MAGRPVEGGGLRTLEPGQAVEHETDDVAPAALEVVGVLQRDSDCRRDGAGVDQVEPAEGDDAEEQMCRIALR